MDEAVSRPWAECEHDRAVATLPALTVKQEVLLGLHWLEGALQHTFSKMLIYRGETEPEEVN